MVATYPDDIVFDVNTFSVIGSVWYNNTGAETDFPLGANVAARAEILAYIDGILQDTSLYTTSNNGGSVSFFSPPNASNLYLKSVVVPSNLLKVIGATIQAASVYYSNTAIQTIDGGDYLIDGVRTSWALPNNTAATAKSELIVAVDGVTQIDPVYTYPSSTLGYSGIDIIPALAANNTLQIRVLSTVVSQENDRCIDMSNRKPDKGFNFRRNINVIKFESQGGYESRRLMSRKPLRTWELTYTNVSGTEKEAMETFYNNRYGEWESFRFDLTHVNELSGFVTVRFDGELEIQHNFTKGTGLNDNFYTLNVTLKEVND